VAKLDQQITTLQERLQLLKLRQQRADARRLALDAQRARKEQTRRKILVGGLILDRVAAGELPAGQLRDWLDGALTHADDRALFELPPRTDGDV
jgi:large subunit ribosomal protein L7/L12